MTELLLFIAVPSFALVLILQIMVLRRRYAVDLSPVDAALQSVRESYERTERSVREEIANNREEASQAARQSREELTITLKSVTESLGGRLEKMTGSVEQRLDAMRHDTGVHLQGLQERGEKHAALSREEASSNGQLLRQEVAHALTALGEGITANMTQLSEGQKNQLAVFSVRLDTLTEGMGQSLASMRQTIEQRMNAVQDEVSKKLTEARQQIGSDFKGLREEISANLNTVRESTIRTMTEIAGLQKQQLDSFSIQLGNLTETTENKHTALIATLAERLSALQKESRERLDQMHQESSEAALQISSRVTTALAAFHESVGNRITDLSVVQKTQLSHMQDQLLALTTGNEKRLDTLRGAMDERLKLIQEESAKKLDQSRLETGTAGKQTREEMTTALTSFNVSVLNTMTGISEGQNSQMGIFTSQLGKLTESNEQKLESLKTAVECKLKSLQDDNSKQLEQMRATVDEKLQGTLDKRLGESFKQVSERLEAVCKGLGEMQTLATGVGDLKRVLTNVKTRGTWGEVQLGAMLAEVLTPDQYSENVSTKQGGERVEFAVKLPGRGQDKHEMVWLPIDAKFPLEDYQRLVEAQERGDVEASDAAGKQLDVRIKQCAGDICGKYLNPPMTTDFAILFLPTEGLFCEVLRRNGLAQSIQRDCRVVIAGPTTLWSILNSLQMGFKTLAIQKSSSEVWNLLAAVKTEWSKYGEVLDRLQRKLHEASKTVDDASCRTRAIGRKLRDVAELPANESDTVLALSGALVTVIDEDDHE